MLKSASFVFSALLLSGLAASTALAQEAVRNMLAAQIRTQGYVCDKTVKSVKDVKRSRPDHEVWVLTCSNATYRVSRAPDLAAKVDVIR